jgi:hypothetical protein
LEVPLPLHISLSRSIQVPAERREELLNNVTNVIKASQIKAFHVAPSGLKWVSNYDGTRWFLALTLEKPDHDELNRLLTLCNRIVIAQGYPALYAEAIAAVADFSSYFHFSLAWSLVSDVLNKDMISLLERVWQSDIGIVCQRIRIPVNSVLLKIGNNVHSIDLGTKISASSSNNTFR